MITLSNIDQMNSRLVELYVFADEKKKLKVIDILSQKQKQIP